MLIQKETRNELCKGLRECDRVYDRRVCGISPAAVVLIGEMAVTLEELNDTLVELDKDLREIEQKRLRVGLLLHEVPKYRALLARWYRLLKLRTVIDKPPVQQLCAVAQFIGEHRKEEP